MKIKTGFLIGILTVSLIGGASFEKKEEFSHSNESIVPTDLKYEM